MSTLLLALGLVCLFEGLILALIPGRMEELLAWLSSTPIEVRRLIGLLAVILGGGLIAVSSLVAGG